MQEKIVIGDEAAPNLLQRSHSLFRLLCDLPMVLLIFQRALADSFATGVSLGLNNQICVMLFVLLCGYGL